MNDTLRALRYLNAYNRTPQISPMKARKQAARAEDDFFTAKAAMLAAERKAASHRAAMEDARRRWDAAKLALET